MSWGMQREVSKSSKVNKTPGTNQVRRRGSQSYSLSKSILVLFPSPPPSPKLGRFLGENASAGSSDPELPRPSREAIEPTPSPKLDAPMLVRSSLHDGKMVEVAEAGGVMRGSWRRGAAEERVGRGGRARGEGRAGDSGTSAMEGTVER